jgi:hypothetical protein
MGSTGINVLVGIFALVIVMLLGFSFMGAPTYQADDLRPGSTSMNPAAPANINK